MFTLEHSFTLSTHFTINYPNIVPTLIVTRFDFNLISGIYEKSVSYQKKKIIAEFT